MSPGECGGNGGEWGEGKWGCGQLLCLVLWPSKPGISQEVSLCVVYALSTAILACGFCTRSCLGCLTASSAPSPLLLPILPSAPHSHPEPQPQVQFSEDPTHTLMLPACVWRPALNLSAPTRKQRLSSYCLQALSSWATPKLCKLDQDPHLQVCFLSK